MLTTKELAHHVQDHALAHYNEGGWSVLIECYTLAEIESELIEENATTKAQAIACFEEACDVIGELWAGRAY